MIEKIYLSDGATTSPMRTNLHIFSLWSAGSSKMCFKKNVFSSVICQKSTNWQTAKNRMREDWGSIHLTWVQLTGVNCKTARLILSDVEWISFMDSHLYSLISKYWQIFMPTQIPNPLQRRMSSITASHQHSTKLGKRWANAIYCK